MFVKYVAFDGAQFSSARDCLEYEKGRTPDYALFGSDGRVANIGEAYLIIVKSECGVNQLETLAELQECGHPGIESPGTWVWSDELDDFVRLNDSVPRMIAKIQNGEWE